MRRADPTPTDDGIALVLVLLFVMVSGVLVTALLRQSFTTFAAAKVAADVENRTYAAGGGLDWGMQQVRQGNVLGGAPVCATAAAGEQTLPDAPMIDGRTLTVTCQMIDGRAPGADGWSVFITTAAGISTPATPLGARSIRGAVHNPGAWTIDGASPLRVDGADVIGPAAAPCEVPAGLVTVSAPPYGYTCGAATSDPVPPAPVDLTGELAALPAQSPTGNGADAGCRVFSPGEYAQAPALLPRADGINYFRSGVYRFASPGVVVVDDAVVIGGIPTPDDDPVLGIDTRGCPVQDAGSTGGHYGVVIALGPTTSLQVTNRGRLELFRYVDGPGSGLSVYQPAASLGAPAVDAPEGRPADLVLHGNVYTPNAAVRVASNGTVRFTGGVVASQLELASTLAVDGEPQVSLALATGSVGHRTVRLVSRTNQVDAERDIAATAIVELANDSADPLLVKAWTVSP